MCYNKVMEKHYYKHKLENLLVISRIVTIHYFEFDRMFEGPVEAHDFWELVYAEKESIICMADRKEILLGEGEALFHKPNELHSLRANGNTAPNVFVISFVCKSEAMHFFENRKMHLNQALLTYIYALIEEGKKTFDIPYSNPFLKKMILLPNPALGGQQIIKNYLEILLINLIRNESAKKDSGIVFFSGERYGEKIAEQAVAYLKAHLQEHLTVTQICEALNYNKSYIFKQFKLATGHSVMSYFMHLKVERAKQLLRESELTVTQISDMLAFDTPNYFSKCFKKMAGYTPLQYKKMHRHLP